MAPSVNVHVARHVDRRRRNVRVRTMVDTVLRVLEGRNRRFVGSNVTDVGNGVGVSVGAGDHPYALLVRRRRSRRNHCVNESFRDKNRIMTARILAAKAVLLDPIVPRSDTLKFTHTTAWH